jgi:hypothetical protein
MRIRTGDGGAAGNVRNVRRRGLCRRRAGRRRFLCLDCLGQVAGLVALGQDLYREVRAVALAKSAADAVRRLDDRVVSQQEAVLRTDLDADIAALAPFVDPANVDVVDDGGGEVWSPFGGVWSGRG